MALIIKFIHPKATVDSLGLLPYMLNDRDLAPAKEQLDRGYAHGGGWRPFHGFRFVNGCLVYPGDPPFQPIAEMQLREERIVLFMSDWVAIFQPDGSFEVARMD